MPVMKNPLDEVYAVLDTLANYDLAWNQSKRDCIAMDYIEAINRIRILLGYNIGVGEDEVLASVEY